VDTTLEEDFFIDMKNRTVTIKAKENEWLQELQACVSRANDEPDCRSDPVSPISAIYPIFCYSVVSVFRLKRSLLAL